MESQTFAMARRAHHARGRHRAVSQSIALPRCEECRKEPAPSFSWFADRQRWCAPCSGRWKFTGTCTADSETYYVMLNIRGHGFLDSPASRANWLRHLQEKRWFNRADFFAMLARLEAASGGLTRRRRATSSCSRPRGTRRYIAVLRSAAPLGGICPACARPMDAHGCRIAVHYLVREASRIRTGVAQIVEVFCAGAPRSPVAPCPRCSATENA
jgi:hypothetical protein